MYPRYACEERARVRGKEASRHLLFIIRSDVHLQDLTLSGPSRQSLVEERRLTPFHLLHVLVEPTLKGFEAMP